MNSAAVNIHVHGFVWTDVFPSLGSIPGNEIAKSYGNSMFNLLKNCQTAFHRNCAILSISCFTYGETKAEDQLWLAQESSSWAPGSSDLQKVPESFSFSLESNLRWS